MERILLTFGLICFLGAAHAQETAPLPAPKPGEAAAGDLLITPARVVLEGRKRTESVMLNNRGGKEATYRITLLKKRMNDDGSYEDIDEKNPPRPGEQFADELVRYSPRQVTLKPGESQTVKFMMRADGAAAGEYRSHVLFNAVPELSQGTDVDQDPAAAGQLSVKLIPVYGLSIPVIVRVGDLAATATITNPQLSADNVSITILRSGTRSLYGDIIATDAAGNVLGQVNGIAVFTPNEKRTVRFKLQKAATGITITYRERQEDGGKTIAQARI